MDDDPRDAVTCPHLIKLQYEVGGEHLLQQEDLMHPADKIREWLPQRDFGVLHHALASHGRDYVMILEIGGVHEPGTYEVRFTHCVELAYETRVSDEVWPRSCSEEFTD